MASVLSRAKASSAVRQLACAGSKIRMSSSTASEIKKVGMIGLGLMGHGIAQSAAMAGFPVVAVEAKEEQLNTGRARITGSLTKIMEKQVKKGTISQQEAKDKQEATESNIQYTLDKSDLSDCDLVIEAIIENIDVKKPLYRELSDIVKPSGILASNTSSLRITDMAEASTRKDKVIGLHFFNPVQIMKLVEVISTEHTDPTVAAAAVSWVKAIGKVPVTCQDTPGFIVNRLLVPNLAQSLLLLDKGVASKEDIDTSMKLGAGHPMGPITLADYVGLDTTLYILEGWVRDYPNEPAFVVPQCLKDKVAEGKFGRKTGEGFYKWDGDKRL